jgi:NTP pyrophosphatase (non-canonical NTP hydrolase)
MTQMRSADVISAIVIGACNELLAKLTMLDEPITLGSGCDASPAIEQIESFVSEKGMAHNYCDHDWHKTIQRIGDKMNDIEAEYSLGLENDIIGHKHAVVLNNLSKLVYQSCVDAGWYTDLGTGGVLDRNIPEMLCLIHSEISEGLEGYRKDKMDDHLPHRKMIEVELADTVIRIFDLCGYMGLDLGGAIAEKFAYNQNRPDHKLENRQAEDGKKI